MNNQKKVSVIVPVYKVEEYLERCVRTIINQTYKNLEIYLVDDGSPDRCGELCERYAKEDSRIKVIHKENGGLSDARNAALDVFSGDYVTFIDSDDYVSVKYIENLVEALESSNSDMSISWFENVYDDTVVKEDNRSVSETLKVYDPEQCLKKMLYQDGVETTAWGKLYKREAFDEIRYPKGKLYEDVPVTYKIIHASKNIAVIENKDYYYFQRRDSIQYESYRPAKMDAVKHMREVVEFVDKTYPSISNAATCRYLSTVCNILFQINSKDYEDDRKKLWGEVKKNRRCVLFDSQGRKKARLAAALSYFGYPIMRFVYKKTQSRG